MRRRNKVAEVYQKGPEEQEGQGREGVLLDDGVERSQEEREREREGEKRSTKGRRVRAIECYSDSAIVATTMLALGGGGGGGMSKMVLRRE